MKSKTNQLLFIKRRLAQTFAVIAIVVLSQSCSKDNATVSQPATNYSYDPASIKSILEVVNAKHGTNYSGNEMNAASKVDEVPYIKGIVDKYYPSRCYQPFNWFCEIIIYGKTSGKETGGLIGKKVDVISCTSPEPTLYKDVTIKDYIVTPDATELVFE